MARARQLLIVLTLVAGLTAACSDDDGDALGSSTTTSLGSSTTVVPPQVTATSEATTTSVAPAGDLVLRGDGLGVTDLGDEPRVAVEAVTAVLGAPTADTGWESSFGQYGTCPGGQIRGVEWDHLVLLFTDGETAYGSEGVEHLFSWRITGSPPALGTATGFGYRATAADAEELYPGRVEVVPAADPFPSFLSIDADGGPIRAYLDDTDTVTNLEAGVACGE